MKRTLRILLSLLLPTLLLTPSGAAAEVGQRYALVLGNSDYQALNALDNPKRDARAVAVKLKGLGFSLLDADGQVTEGPVLDLDMTRFTYAVQTFAQRVRGAQIAFVYYAGHGMQLEGRSYLLPVDTPLPDPQRDRRLEILRRYAQPLDGILQDLDGQAQLTVAVFDACREIPKLDRALRGLSRATGIGMDGFRGLGRIQSEGRSRIVAYAGGFGQLVADGDTGHSPYTATLLQHLDAKGVPVEQIFQTVAWQFGQRHGGQNPEVLIQGVEPAHFYFLAPVRIQVTPPSPDPESELWLAMQKCGTAACLHAYLDSYPSGRFAAAAKALLASLTPSPAPAPPTPDPAVRLKDELALCRRHLEANRLTTGIGGTALDCYRGVLSQDPANAEALAGLEAIVSRYLGWAEGLLAQRRFDPAAEYLAKAAGILPESPAVRALQARLEAARRPGGPPPPWERLPAAIRPRRRSRVPGRGRMPLPQPWATAWSGSRRAVFRWAARPRSRGEAMTRNSTGCA